MTSLAEHKFEIRQKATLLYIMKLNIQIHFK